MAKSVKKQTIIQVIISWIIISMMSISLYGSLLEDQRLDVNSTSTTPSIGSVDRMLIVSDSETDWFGDINLTSSKMTDYENNSGEWGIEQENNITWQKNSDTNLSIGFSNGFSIDMIAVSSSKITAINEYSFDDLYLTQVHNIVTNPGTGWSDVWDWAPSYWDDEAEINRNVTTVDELRYMFLSNNNWFDSDTYAMLSGELNATSGDVVSGEWDGTYYDGCEGDDCRVITRTTNVIGSWEYNGTAINLDLPQEYKSLSLVSDQNSSTGFFISEAGLDKVGTIWNDEIFTGSDASVQLVQTLLDTLSDQDSADQNGFTIADISDKNYFLAYSDDGNITLEKMSFGSLDSNNDGTLSVNVYSYNNGSVNPKENFSMQIHLDDNGTITGMWSYDNNGETCSGNNIYTLIERKSLNGIDTLQVNGSSYSSSGCEDSDSWQDVWYMDNGNIDSTIDQPVAAVAAINSVSDNQNSSPTDITSKFAGKTFYTVNETNTSIESWAFNQNMTQVTWIDGQESGTDDIRDINNSSFCIVASSETCDASDYLTFMNGTDNSMEVNMDNFTFVLFYNETDAKDYYGFNDSGDTPDQNTSTTYHEAYGYSWLDVQKDERYLVEGNSVSLDDSGVFTITATFADDNISRAEIKSIFSKRAGLGAVVELTSNEVGDGQFRIGSLVSSEQLGDINTSGLTGEIYFVARFKITSTKLKAQTLLVDNYGNYIMGDTRVFDDSSLTNLLNNKLKLIIKFENGVMVFVVKNVDTDAIIQTKTIEISPLSIDGFEIGKFRATIDDSSGSITSAQATTLKVYGVFQPTIDTGGEPITSIDGQTISFEKHQFNFNPYEIRNWIYDGTTFMVDDTETFTQNTTANTITITDSEYQDTSELGYIGEINASTLNSTLFTTSDAKAYKFAMKESWIEDGYNQTEYFEFYLYNEIAFNAIKNALESGTVVYPFEAKITQSDFEGYQFASIEASGLGGVELYGYWLENDGSNDDEQNSFPYKATGSITLPSIDGINGVYIEVIPTDGYNNNGNYYENPSGTFTYTLGMSDGSYILKVGLDTQDGYKGYIYDSNTSTWISEKQVEYTELIIDGNSNYVPDVGFIDTDSFNSLNNLTIDFDMATLYANMYTITGDVVLDANFTNIEYCTNGSDLNTIAPCEWETNGISGFNAWYGANRVSIEIRDAATGDYIGWFNLGNTDIDNNDTTKTVTFSAMVPNAGDYTLHVMKESLNLDTKEQNWEGFYFNPETSKLIEEGNIPWVESNITNSSGYTQWMPDSTKTGFVTLSESGDKSVSFGEINFVSYADSQLVLNGTITFDDADYVRIEFLNTATGYWFGYNEVKESGDPFRVEIPGAGEYIIQATKIKDDGLWEVYYFNPDGTFKAQSSVDWIEYGGIWMPNPAQTGSLVIPDGATQEYMPTGVVVSFTTLDDSFYVVEGNVTVPSSFTISTADNNTSYWNNISFEVTNADTGAWIGWFEVDRVLKDSNETTNTYGYKIRLSSAGKYNLRINYENGKEGSYENYFLDFDNGTLISSDKVEYKEVEVEGQSWTNWVPDFENGIELDDESRNVVANIDFASLESSIYKISGTIILPEDFTPSNSWDSYAMVRIEAIDATTGNWLGDVKISTDNNGTANSYNYTLKLPTAEQNSSIVLKIVKESQETDGWNWESYYIDFNGTDINFISEETTQYQEVGVFNLTTTEIFVVVDYQSEVAEYEANKLAFAGTITLPQAVTLGSSGNYWNSIRIEMIDKDTGDFINSEEVKYKAGTNDTYDFSLDVAKSGAYIIKVAMSIDGEWSEYYINFGEDNQANGTDANGDKIIDGQKVEWVEASTKNQWGYKNWMPNPEQTGYINLNAKVKSYSIDFNTFESSLKKLSGTIAVADDFVVGEKYVGGVWSGYNALRVEAINKTTGVFVASLDIRSEKVAGVYPFELKLGDLDEVGTQFILRIIKEENNNNDYSSKEVYINFGANHTFESDDSLVDGKKVQWIEAEAKNQWGYKNWMPNPAQTGWITITDSVENINTDLSSLGANDFKLSGSVTFKDGFTPAGDENGARISIIDATTGNWIADEPINDDGSFEVAIGEEIGEYIVQINYWHNDYTNWQNSWWKNKFIDFVEGSTTVETVLNDTDVTWKSIDVPGQSWKGWIPDVTPLSVTNSISGLSFDLSVTNSGTISGVINNIPTGAKDGYVSIFNPSTYAGTSVELEAQGDGTYSFKAEEVKPAEYTIEYGYYKDGRFYNYFIKDDNNNTTDGVGTIEGQEVRWVDIGNSIWGPSREDVTYLTVSSGSNFDLNITQNVSAYNQVIITLNGVDDGKDTSVDMSIPGKSFYKWENNTSSGLAVSFTLDEVKNGDNYIINFWYDNASYTCDGTNCDSLKKNAPWVAFDENNTQMCPKADNDWNCDWDGSENWIWKPDVTPVTITGTNGIATVTAEMPQEKQLTGSLQVGSEFAGKQVYMNVYQPNGSDYVWSEFTLDDTGEGNISMKVAGGNDYRIEFWIDGVGGYVYTLSNTWINQNKSWDETTWQPTDDTLINITSSSTTLATFDLSSGMSTVTIVLENLDMENGEVVEDVWVNLEHDTNGWYGEGNGNWEQYPVTYDTNITLLVPSSANYRISVYPSNHKGGYGSDGDTDQNETITAITKLSWDNKDYLGLTSNATIHVTLPSLETLGDINGSVVCGESDCSGWIEAWNGTDGKGIMVQSDGTFSIKGLEAGDYDVSYWSNTGLYLETATRVSVNANSVTTISLEKEESNMISSITGTISANNLTGISAVLIKTDGSEFEVVGVAKLDESGYFSFDSRTKPKAGEALVVAAAKRTFNDDFSSSIKFDEATEVYDSANSVDMPSSLETEDFATGLSATANEQ